MLKSTVYPSTKRETGSYGHSHLPNKLLQAQLRPRVELSGRKRNKNRTAEKETVDKKKEEHFVVSPGYNLTRGKDRISVTLGEEFFGSISPTKTDRENSTRKVLECKIDGIIEDFQEQIAHLTALLEQEKRDHRKTKEKMTRELKEIIGAVEKKNEEVIRTLREAHASDIRTLQEQSKAMLEEQKTEEQMKYEDLWREFEFLKSSFLTYKESIAEEMEEKQMIWEADRKKSHEDEKKMALLHQKQTLLDNFEKKHQEALTAAQSEIELIQKKHLQEKQDLWQQYAHAVQDSKRNQKLLEAKERHEEEMKARRKRKKQSKNIEDPAGIVAELEAIIRQKRERHCHKIKPETPKYLKMELSEKKENVVNLNEVLQQSQEEVKRMKNHLLQGAEVLQQKISGLNAKNDHTIHSLMQENADLRRKIITKSEELLQEIIKEKLKEK